MTSYGWTYGLSPETEGVLMQEDDASVRRSTYRLSEGLIANFINISMYSLIQASGTYPFQDGKIRKHASFENILSRTMQMYYHNFIWGQCFYRFRRKYPINTLESRILFKFESVKISFGSSILNGRISLDSVILGLCSSGLYLQIYKNESNHVRRINGV